MKNLENDTFLLNNFEGPLSFLLHLIQKNEIDIYEIDIQKITTQYLQKLEEILEPDVDNGAEFIGTAASLVCLKSRMLLPKHEQAANAEDEELDPHFEIIHQLIDYCRFKEAAKELAEREQAQNGFYSRGMDGNLEIKKPLGIEHISLEELANLFNQVMIKASSQKGLIHEETWRVSDKIILIRKQVRQGGLKFEELFTSQLSKEELIVTFLAVLELMKLGEIRVIKELNLGIVMIIGKQDYEQGN